MNWSISEGIATYFEREAFGVLFMRDVQKLDRKERLRKDKEYRLVKPVLDEYGVMRGVTAFVMTPSRLNEKPEAYIERILEYLRKAGK